MGSKSRTIHWHCPENFATAAVESWLRDARREYVLHNNPRRRIVQLEDENGRPLLVKQFRSRTGLHPTRDRFKSMFGRAPARREWNTLRRLQAADIPVPKPLAWGSLPNGDHVLITEFCPGATLTDMKWESPKQRRQTLVRLGEIVALMHRRGFVHGDLHHGNVLIGLKGPILLDWQHSKTTHNLGAIRQDRAFLDYSLARLVSTADRIRVRATVLGLQSPFGALAKERLREVSRDMSLRAEEHARSRTRRSLRPGRRFAKLQLGRESGLHLRDFPSEAVSKAITAHREALARGGDRVLKNDGRSRITSVDCEGQRLVIKEVLPRKLGRIMADRFRGSSGFRAWRAGHGLLARDIGAALPLAFSERCRLGFPVSSLVILQDLSPAKPADTLWESNPHSTLSALCDIAIRLHRRGIDHGDLKASHVYIADQGNRCVAKLLDLEGVKFRGRLSDRARIQALTELNASLRDEFPSNARCELFKRYARVLPFDQKKEQALETIVHQSLNRNHRWTGAGCEIAQADRD